MEARYEMLVNGKMIGGSRTLDVVDPATAEVFATCACASREEIEDAVTAAAAAFPAWSATSLDERRALLIKMAEAIEANLDSLARTLTREQGKPVGDAQGEVGGAAYFLRYYAGIEIPVETIEDSDARRIEREGNDDEGFLLVGHGSTLPARRQPSFSSGLPASAQAATRSRLTPASLGVFGPGEIRNACAPDAMA